MTSTIQIIRYRPVRDMRPVLGFCKVLFPSGISIAEIVIMRGRHGLWASPPTQTWTKNGRVILNAAGRVRHTKLIEFPSAEIRKQWSDSIIAAMHERHPGFDSETTTEDFINV
jgi:hypothetical protein